MARGGGYPVMTLFQAFGQFANSGGVTFVAGWKLMKPSSVVLSGGTASVSAGGQVAFTSASAVSLNDVFTSEYDNYAVSIYTDWSGATQAAGLTQLRAAGSNDSGSNYHDQYFLANQSTIGGARSTSVSYMRIGNVNAVGNVEMYYIFAPNLAQPTALRSVATTPQTNVSILDFGSRHSSASAYDGFTFYVTADDVSGTISVFGMDS